MMLLFPAQPLSPPQQVCPPSRGDCNTDLAAPCSPSLGEQSSPWQRTWGSEDLWGKRHLQDAPHSMLLLGPSGCICPAGLSCSQVRLGTGPGSFPAARCSPCAEPHACNDPAFDSVWDAALLRRCWAGRGRGRKALPFLAVPLPAHRGCC